MTTQQAVKQISVKEAKAKLEAGAQAIDTAPAADWAGGHVAGAMNLPLMAIRSRQGEVPADTVLLFICEDGVRSAEAAAKAVELGFKEVYNVQGGTRAWIAAGYEVEALM